MIATLDECPPALSGAALSVADLDGRFFVAQTRSRAEKAMARDLLAAGVDYYLPLAEQAHRDKHRNSYVAKVPIFPGYVFCCGDEFAQQAAREIGYRNAHLCTIVPISAGSQKRIRDDLINVETALARNARIEPCPFAVTGARVRIASGKFQGIEGICISRGKGSIIVIGVQGFGAATLEIDGEQLEPA